MGHLACSPPGGASPALQPPIGPGRSLGPLGLVVQHSCYRIARIVFFIKSGHQGDACPGSPINAQMMHFINRKYKIYHSERSEESVAERIESSTGGQLPRRSLPPGRAARA